jgi:hypothetical protein
VAAKAQGMLRDCRPLVRRSVRMRRVSSMPKPLQIPALVPEEADARPTTLYNPSTCGTMPFLPLDLPPLQPLHSFEVDMGHESDLEFNGGVDDKNMCGIEVDEGSVPEVDEAFYAGFPNYSSVSFHDRKMSLIDHEVHQRRRPVDDLYGWEAELDRQTNFGVGKAEGDWDCEQVPCRGSEGPKRKSLLHRFFQMQTKS